MAGISTDELRPGRALMNAGSMTSLREGALPQEVERDFESQRIRLAGDPPRIQRD
jgi:hypothetical protein